jgi:hypothetical protein
MRRHDLIRTTEIAFAGILATPVASYRYDAKMRCLQFNKSVNEMILKFEYLTHVYFNTVSKAAK